MWQRKIQMKLLVSIKNIYFKIPRKIRFLFYYLIAFYMFLNRENSGISINIEGGAKEFLAGLMYLPTGIMESIRNGTFLESLIMFVVGWLFLFVFFIYYSLPITVLYFVERNVVVRIKRDNTRYTAEENILYYRELLNNISPSVISIIDDFKIEPKKDVVAGILKLILSGHVKIDKNNIEVIEKDVDDLSISQKELYNRIKDGKLEDFETEAWKTECYREATNEGYVFYVENLNHQHAWIHLFKGIAILAVSVPIIILLVFLLTSLGAVIVPMILILGEIIFTGFYLPYLIGYTIYYLLRKSNFRYTEKGEKIKNRIEGLKRFIEDYSSLDEKDKKEVVLWDDYLIYAVIFEQNKSILKDMLKLKGLEIDITFDEFSFINDL